MITDPELKRVFKNGFQTAYTRDKNLKEYIGRAKLWPQNRQSQRVLNEVGWKPCTKLCMACIHSKGPMKYVYMHYKKEKFMVKHKLKCTDKNVIYVIDCLKCLIQYMCSIEGTFKDRATQWRSDIGLNTKTDKVVAHFNTKGHSLSLHFQMVPVEKVYGDSDTRKIRERMYVDYYDLIEHGLNTNRTT